MQKGFVGLAISAGVMVAASSSRSSASDYSPGETWIRVNQFPAAHFYEPGKNYLRGNPWVDDKNNFVWSYEYVVSNGGDHLSDDPMPPTPWYRHGQPELLVWDDAFREGGGSWVYADDTPCRINDVELVHDWGAESGDAWMNVPVIRWRNPLEDGARFSVSGQLVVEWVGGDSQVDPYVDVVLLYDKRRGPNDPVFPLFATTLSRADGDIQTIPIEIADFRPRNSESLLLSAKAKVSGPATTQVARVIVRDELVITLERAPRGYCPEDFNRDGIVDFVDLNRILFLFGLDCHEIP